MPSTVSGTSDISVKGSAGGTLPLTDRASGSRAGGCLGGGDAVERGDVG